MAAPREGYMTSLVSDGSTAVYTCNDFTNHLMRDVEVLSQDIHARSHRSYTLAPFPMISHFVIFSLSMLSE